MLFILKHEQNEKYINYLFVDVAEAIAQEWREDAFGEEKNRGNK